MPDISTITLFCLTTFFLLITPGTGMLYVIARSTGQGWNACFVSVLGLCAGDLVHLFSASVGLSAVIITSVLAYKIVRYMGAAYMIYLGIRIIQSNGYKVGVNVSQQISLSEIFSQAALSSVLNPKVAIFFLAFLPQFIDSNRKPVFWQTITFGVIWIGMTLFGYTLIAFVSGKISRWLQKHLVFIRLQKWFAGTILIILGIHLMLSEQ